MNALTRDILTAGTMGVVLLGGDAQAPQPPTLAEIVTTTDTCKITSVETVKTVDSQTQRDGRVIIHLAVGEGAGHYAQKQREATNPHTMWVPASGVVFNAANRGSRATDAPYANMVYSGPEDPIDAATNLVGPDTRPALTMQPTVETAHTGPYDVYLERVVDVLGSHDRIPETVGYVLCGSLTEIANGQFAETTPHPSTEQTFVRQQDLVVG